MPLEIYLIYIAAILFLIFVFILILCVACTSKKQSKNRPGDPQPLENFSADPNNPDFSDDEDEIEPVITLRKEDYDEWFPVVQIEKIKKKGEKIFEDTCSICLEKLDEGGEVRKIKVCGHMFHGECLLNWIKFNESCPNCKEALNIEHLKVRGKEIQLKKDLEKRIEMNQDDFSLSPSLSSKRRSGKAIPVPRAALHLFGKRRKYMTRKKERQLEEENFEDDDQDESFGRRGREILSIGPEKETRLMKDTRRSAKGRSSGSGHRIDSLQSFAANPVGPDYSFNQDSNRTTRRSLLTSRGLRSTPTKRSRTKHPDERIGFKGLTSIDFKEASEQKQFIDNRTGFGDEAEEEKFDTIDDPEENGDLKNLSKNDKGENFPEVPKIIKKSPMSSFLGLNKSSKELSSPISGSQGSPFIPRKSALKGTRPLNPFHKKIRFKPSETSTNKKKGISKYCGPQASTTKIKQSKTQSTGEQISDIYSSNAAGARLKSQIVDTPMLNPKKLVLRVDSMPLQINPKFSEPQKPEGPEVENGDAFSLVNRLMKSADQIPEEVED